MMMMMMIDVPMYWRRGGGRVGLVLFGAYSLHGTFSLPVALISQPYQSQLSISVEELLPVVAGVHRVARGCP
jgi:hypothetical protein